MVIRPTAVSCGTKPKSGGSRKMLRRVPRKNTGGEYLTWACRGFCWSASARCAPSIRKALNRRVEGVVSTERKNMYELP